MFPIPLMHFEVFLCGFDSLHFLFHTYKGNRTSCSYVPIYSIFTPFFLRGAREASYTKKVGKYSSFFVLFFQVVRIPFTINFGTLTMIWSVSVSSWSYSSSSSWMVFCLSLIHFLDNKNDAEVFLEEWWWSDVEQVEHDEDDDDEDEDKLESPSTSGEQVHSSHCTATVVLRGRDGAGDCVIPTILSSTWQVLSVSSGQLVLSTTLLASISVKRSLFRRLTVRYFFIDVVT